MNVSETSSQTDQASTSQSIEKQKHKFISNPSNILNNPLRIDTKQENKSFHYQKEQNKMSKNNIIFNERYDEMHMNNDSDESSIETRSSTNSQLSKSRPHSSKFSRDGYRHLNGLSHKNPLIHQKNQNNASASLNSMESMSNGTFDEDEDDDDDGNDDGDDDEDFYQHAVSKIEGQYDPNDYLDLNVSPEIEQLFHFISSYQPPTIELDTPLKCFIPSYIPAIGEIDAFIKMPRPDDKKEELGLKVLDEPSLNQSNAAVLELQLKATTKKRYGDVLVRSIDNASKNPHEIEQWITNIEKLHRSKPPAQVHYTKNFPTMDQLMIPWPEELENKFVSGDLKPPDPDLDLSVEEYGKLLCVLLDIPVYPGKIVESLHLMMILFLNLRDIQVSYFIYLKVVYTFYESFANIVFVYHCL